MGPPIGSQNGFKHGYNKRGLTHSLYKVWDNMLQRCYNPKATLYNAYGRRNILVCEEWKHANLFIEWALSHGWKKGLQIERIDNDGNYEPKNCTFKNRKHQANNRRTNVMVTINNQDMTFAEAVDKYGKVKYETARQRWKNLGWDLMEALQS